MINGVDIFSVFISCNSSVTCLLLLKRVCCVDKVTITAFDLRCFLWVLYHRATLHAVTSCDSIRWYLVDRLALTTLNLRWALNKLKHLLAFVALSTTLW